MPPTSAARARHLAGVFWQDQPLLRAHYEAGLEILRGHDGANRSFTNPRANDKTLQGALYEAGADRRSWEHRKLFFSGVLR